MGNQASSDVDIDCPLSPAMSPNAKSKPSPDDSDYYYYLIESMHSQHGDDDGAPVKGSSIIGNKYTKTTEKVNAGVNDSSYIADKSLITLNLDEDDSTVALSEDDSAYASSRAAMSGNLFEESPTGVDELFFFQDDQQQAGSPVDNVHTENSSMDGPFIENASHTCFRTENSFKVDWDRVEHLNNSPLNTSCDSTDTVYIGQISDTGVDSLSQFRGSVSTIDSAAAVADISIDDHLEEQTCQSEKAEEEIQTRSSNDSCADSVKDKPITPKAVDLIRDVQDKNINFQTQSRAHVLPALAGGTKVAVGSLIGAVDALRGSFMKNLEDECGPNAALIQELERLRVQLASTTEKLNNATSQLSTIEEQNIQLKAKLSKEEETSKTLGLELNDVRVEFACTVSELVDSTIQTKSLQAQNAKLQNKLATIHHEHKIQTDRTDTELQALKRDLEAQRTRTQVAEERLEAEKQRTKAAEATVNIVLEAAWCYTEEEEDEVEESSTNQQEEYAADDESTSTFSTTDETIITAHEDDPTVALLPKISYDHRSGTKYSFTEDEVFHFKKSLFKQSKPTKHAHKTLVDRKTPKTQDNMLLQLLTPLSH